MHAPELPGVSLRPIAEDDGEALLAFWTRNRSYFEPWLPLRDETWFTLEAQQAAARRSAELRRDGRGYHFLVVAGGGVVGRVALNEVVRGAFDNAYLGYMVDEAAAGRGYGTAAVCLAVRFAFAEAGLHRVQAAVMPRNVASARVLEKAGFREEGLARRYLRIAGVWEDHRLFAVTAEEV